MYIEKVTIRNFRSIVDQAFEVKNLTVLLGKNDVGKSNFLKALNLFFNNQTDFGHKFDFDIDYSRLAIPKKKKAKEIAIELVLSPPTTYRDHSKKILWTKRWREDGLYDAGEKEVVFADGSKITKRSRLRVWLRRLRYRYVPAIKGSDYFSFLLKELYETLYSTIRSDLQSAGQNFVTKIREQTEPLSLDLEQKLGFLSKIQLPEDLSELFSTLDFETSSREHLVSLKQRGDGIKARHVPIILQFLAEKERLHHAKGAVRHDTIWGYEEPENNLELLQAFKLADEFVKYSNDIQIFLTTHSPAFYTIGGNQPTNIVAFNTYLDSSTRSSKLKQVVNNDDARLMDESMGLLPLVAPYVKEKEEEINKLTEIINEHKDNKKPTLLVEGLTDMEILNNAWSKLNKGTRMPFDIRQGFDRHFIGNTFLREDIFKKSPDVIFIGMLDFDEAFENWERLKESKNSSGIKNWDFAEQDSGKGLLLGHKTYNGYVFLLPAPTDRTDYASLKFGKFSTLSIELLFRDDLLNDYVEEKDLPGGGKIKKAKDEKKGDFAKQTKNFTAHDFVNFNPIFTMISHILDDKYNCQIT